MKTLSAIALAASVLVSGTAFSSDDLAKKNGCAVCHDAVAKKMGPSWKDVAAKNKGVKDAEKMIAGAIVNGSKGKYGKIPMPPQAKAKADAPALAKWILAR
jgi:cytochrome c